MTDLLRDGTLARPLDISVRTHLFEYITTAEQYELSNAAKCLLEASIDFAAHTVQIHDSGARKTHALLR